MKCIACQHDGDDFHKLIFMTDQSKEDATPMIRGSQYDGKDNFDYQLVNLYACPKCETVRMQR